MMSLCDESWDLIRSYGVQVPDGANVSGITNPVFQHWCQQKPVSELSHCIIAVLLVLICVISVIGNLLVVIVFTRYRRLRSPANILIVNLAASDLLNGLLHPMAAYSAFQGRWSFGRGGCEAYAALCGLFGLVSIVTLTAIAVERCLVISVKPWHGTVLFTHSKAKAAIGVVWIYCLALVLPPVALGWGAFVPEGFLTSCSFDYLSRTRPNRAYFFFLFSFGFFLPITLIGICYTFILQTVFQNERTMKLNHVIKSHHSKVKRSEYRAAEMILMVIALFLVSWTPYSIIACLGQFGDKNLLTPWVSVLPSLFAKMSTLYNPAIYGLSHRHFRAALKRMFGKDPSRMRSGTYFSRNSSLGRARRGCPCLPLTCTSDVLEDNSSSLTGKKVYVGSPQGNCGLLPDRNNYAMEDLSKLCVCGRVKMVSRDFISKLNNSPVCLQYIPASTKLSCDQSTPCVSDPNSMYKHPFFVKECCSLMKLHSLDAQKQGIPDQGESVAPETPFSANNSHCDQCTSCMSVATLCGNNHTLCPNSFIKLHVLDLHSDQRREMPGQDKSPSLKNLYIGEDFDCHSDTPFRCFHKVPPRNDFKSPSIAKYSMQRQKKKRVPYRNKGLAVSMESGLVHNKSIPSVCHPEISCSSAESIRKPFDECHECPVLHIKHKEKPNPKHRVYRRRKSECSDMQWPSMCNRQNEQSPLRHSCQICEPKDIIESSLSYNFKTSRLKCESALSKRERCFDKFKVCVLEAKSENQLKLKKIPQNQLETNQNQNSKILVLSHEEMPMCLECISNSCGDNFTTKKEILSSSQEEASMCPKCISNSCGDDFEPKKPYQNNGRQITSVHPSLPRSLMFRSERSIHHKYETNCEYERTVKAGCLPPKSFGKRRCPISETRRATVILEAGRMKEIIRRSSVNEP